MLGLESRCTFKLYIPEEKKTKIFRLIAISPRQPHKQIWWEQHQLPVNVMITHFY
jgi:hypothetical protein